MIKITFRHSRDLFIKNLFKSWVYKSFNFNVDDDNKPIKFEGCEHGNHYLPSISMSLKTFEESKYKIPLSVIKRITKVEGIFNVVEYLVYGVNNFVNEFDNGDLISSEVCNSLYDWRKRKR